MITSGKNYSKLYNTEHPRSTKDFDRGNGPNGSGSGGMNSGMNSIDYMGIDSPKMYPDLQGPMRWKRAIDQWAPPDTYTQPTNPKPPRRKRKGFA